MNDKMSISVCVCVCVCKATRKADNQIIIINASCQCWFVWMRETAWWWWSCYQPTQYTCKSTKHAHCTQTHMQQFYFIWFFWFVCFCDGRRRICVCVCVWVSVSVEWLWEMSTKWYNVGCRLCLCGCGVVINAFGAHTRLIQGKYLCAEMRALCMCEWELLWRFECLLLIINVLAFGGWTSNIWF